MLRNEKGFTLIEIIAVLVILGILAAVAIPKYFSLLEQSRISAAQGAIGEMKGRASSAYAKLLLSNNGAAPAQATVKSYMGSDVGSDFTLALGDSGSDITITVSAVKGVGVTPNVVGTWFYPTVN